MPTAPAPEEAHATRVLGLPATSSDLLRARSSIVSTGLPSMPTPHPGGFQQLLKERTPCMSRASCHLQGPHKTMIIPHDTGLPFTPSHSGGIQQPPKKPTPCVSRSFLASLRIARDDDCPSPTWAWPIHHGHHIKGSTGTRRSPCHMCPGVPCHLQRSPKMKFIPAASVCLCMPMPHS